jgi:hypothetical protein
MHYRDREFAAFLLSGNGHMLSSLRARGAFGSELLSIDISRVNSDSSIPKRVQIYFFLKDSLVPQRLVTRKPKFREGDECWELDFGDRPLIPSVKNSIFVGGESDVEFMDLRQVEKNLFEVAAVDVLSPLAVFGVMLAVLQCPT